jgi:hypothetical protein
MKWLTARARDSRTDIHVLPLNDLREHVEVRTCWCAPGLEQVRHEDGRKACVLVRHNSMDGRELVERHGVM